MSGIEVVYLADAPFEANAGPPGRVDVADIITTVNSTTIAAGFVESEGGPFAYCCDYEAVCIPLDDTMTWDTGAGSHATNASDVIWIPNGGRASYHSTELAQFVYDTFPVNWPEIVGWNAGEDIKDLSALGDVGKLEAVSLTQLTDPRMPWMTARRSSGSQFEHAVVTRLGLGVAMTTMLIRTDAATGWNLGAGEGLILMLQRKARFGSEGMEACVGDIVWKPEDEPLRMETSGSSLCVSVSAPSGKPANGPNTH